MFLEDKHSYTAVETMPETRKFLAWVKSKPADEYYEWTDSCKCACGQYFGDGCWVSKVMDIQFYEGVNFNSIAGHTISKDDWTFGKLAQRLERRLEPA